MDATRRDIRLLAWSSRALLTVLSISCIDLALDKFGAADPIPDSIDIFVALGGLLIALFILITTERQRRRVREAYLADRAALASFQDAAAAEAETARAKTAEIKRVIGAPADDGGLRMVFQPIVELATGTTVGFEALARFPTGGPDTWFPVAAEVGLGADLELAAIERALEDFESYISATGLYLSVNCSPATLVTDRFWDLFRSHDPTRLVIEVTEHVPVDAYDQYADVLRLVRRLGARLAIDDAGAGYSSLRHIVQLEPNIVKIDRAFVEVDVDPSKRTAVQAFVDLARSMNATVVAEGVETEAQRQALEQLGVRCGQGWLLGRPRPAATWVEERILQAS